MLKKFQHFLFGIAIEKRIEINFLITQKGGIMSITKWNNGKLPGLTNLFDDFLSRDLSTWGLANHSTTNTTLPAVNIRETAENFEVEMAAPGMKKEDFKIELEGNELRIGSERQTENDTREGERYTRREFSYQSFQRSFTLPRNVVDVEQIQAKYENGVLQLLIPKREEAKQKPPRMIQVQ